MLLLDIGYLLIESTFIDIINYMVKHIKILSAYLNSISHVM